MRPIDYAKEACDAIMCKFSPATLPPQGTLFYHQGVFLSGMERVYKLCRDKKYFNYIKDYIDCVIGENGEIYGVDYEVTQWKPEPEFPENLKIKALTMLDCKQPVILLYNLLDETGDEKYKKAIETISQSMYYWPVNDYGGYWHMMDQCNQMWLDGLYMAAPLSVMYSQRFGDNRLAERAVRQAIVMAENMKDSETGLYYHGWDPSKSACWADKKTGLSAHFWGRAVGWYAVAILDMLDFISQDHPQRERLEEIEANLLKALAKYQDEKTGMWFNVLDRTDCEKNWIESSCTNLFIYAYAKAIRTGVITEEYSSVLEKAYKGIVDNLHYDDEGHIVIDKVCVGTCIDDGTYEHYINRWEVINDLHGVGAFVLMCTEMELYLKNIKSAKTE